MLPLSLSNFSFFNENVGTGMFCTVEGSTSNSKGVMVCNG